MPVTLKVYANEDDALLYWSVASPVPQCRGFAIERKLTDAHGVASDTFLPNRIGFENEVVPQPADGSAPTKPSTDWPFQRFSWTDHDADSGDTVSYRVIPVVRAGATLNQVPAEASDWSAPVTLGAELSGTFQPYFNRGFVISQFIARYLKQQNKTLAQFKATITDKDDTTIRKFLSGDLRLALLKQLQLAKSEHGAVYGALFELSDRELLDAVKALGAKAHLVLANGSITKGKTEALADARKRDENAMARAELIASGVDVQPDRRFIAPGPLGHNKFLVRVGSTGNPLAVWTGSTNWTPTGLCTQVNNGLLVRDHGVAALYLAQWHRLRDAGNTFPDALVTSNSAAQPIGADTSGSVRSITWFTRTRQKGDLDALNALVQGATQGVVFLMFMPGATGLLHTVLTRAAEPNFYVRGVVSELPNGPADESAVDVSLVAGTTHVGAHFDVVEPQGVPDSMAWFAAEVSHQEFIQNIGFAIIHSKVLVIDPFSDDPTVVTGSHNFSQSASTSNDENFIIVKGNKPLAEAYAVNIMGAYAHYRWRAYLASTHNPFNGLKDNDTWQAPMLASNRRDLTFWGV
jgi:phosphatidylserine/phosphatidylglycerophosphate/cardiolipin synthase-like enzyme